MKLSAYFKTTGKSLTACAEEIGVNTSVFHKWVTGQRLPSRLNMGRVKDWSNGAVQPNDFYLTTEADEA